MRHRHAHGAPGVDPMAAAGRLILRGRRTACLLPQLNEQQRRADEADRVREVAPLDHLQDGGDCALGEAVDGGGRSVTAAEASTTPRGSDCG